MHRARARGGDQRGHLRVGTDVFTDVTGTTNDPLYITRYIFSVIKRIEYGGRNEDLQKAIGISLKIGAVSSE
jgi:hypothetical protein